MRVAIVGGGVAGLALGHALLRRGARERGVELVVLESAARPGGNIRSERVDGYLCESGPNGFLDSAPDTLRLVSELGLESRLLPSEDRARRRYIWRGGRLHPLPGGPLSFLGSGLLSWRGKLRIALEPFARERPDGDETIHAFAARRIGEEAASVLVGSMVSGVFAGDARALSLRACFPKMWQMESEHGGLFRALLAKRRASGARHGEPIGSPVGRLTSFRDGTDELVRGLARALDGVLRTGAGVAGLRRAGRQYRLECLGAGPLHADAVVLAGGAAASAALVEPLDGALAATLREIRSAPLAVVCLGYEAARLPRPLDGFGFLVPPGEGPRILGTLWDSSIYPGRAPAGRVLLRAMLGGALDGRVLALDDTELLAAARRDLQTTMGLDAEPDFVKVVRHPLGIPQYTGGHLERLARVEGQLDGHARLYVAGNAYRGVSINSCVAEAGPLAERILSALREG